MTSLPRRQPPPEPPTTDVAQYFADNPEFVACRRKHAWLPEERLETVDAPSNDRTATHHRPNTCQRCGAVFRERFAITIRRGRVTRFDQLASRTEYPAGYLARGVRINRRDVTRHVAVGDIERQLNRPRAVKSRRKRAA